MGISGISPGSLLLILLILIFVLGTKRLRSLGEDLGVAYKSFKKAFEDHEVKDQSRENSKDNINKLN